MRTASRAATAASGALAGALCLSLLALTPASAHATLSPSAYRVGALCSAPPPGYAGCLGLRLIAKHPHSLRGSRASRLASGPAVEQIEYKEPWEGSLSPQNVLSAYSLSGLPAPATQQTLALVDAFNDPTAEHDLEVFDKQYGLPACTTANGCFTKVQLRGGALNTLPPTNAGWAQEIATDVEVAHGVCQSCKILLVEAHSNSNADLETAEEKAVQLGASEISNSWGGPEQGVSIQEDETNAFNHPGTVITVASGDNGYLDWGLEEASERGFADYPASSPHVVAVGGTRLSRTAGGAWKEETVWNGKGAGGGGCSTVLAAPAWQQNVADWSAVGCGSHRAVADVSADADPYTGVAVYDSTPIREGEVEYRGWVPIGGTSVASPIVASTFALAGGAGTGVGGKTVAYPAQTLYENFAANPAALHDVTFGSNGACTKGFDETTGTSNCTLAEEDASCSAKPAICLARSGYDGPTGVGTPHGIAAFESAGEAARIKQLEEQKTAEEKRVDEEKKAAEEHKAEEERLAERKAEEEQQVAAERKAEEERQAKRKAEEERRVAAETRAAKEIAEAEEKARQEKAAKRAREEAAAAGSPNTTTGGGPLSSGPLRAPSLGSVTPIVSAPALTRTAAVALSHSRPRVSRVAFAFTLNVAARVRVTLAKQVTAPGRTRWQTLPFSRVLSAAAGRDQARLSAPGTLAPGRYRLTLAPAGGVGRRLTFVVG
jgi:hypothetical protein